MCGWLESLVIGAQGPVASEVELSNERGQRSSEGQVMQKGGAIFDASVLA